MPSKMKFRSMKTNDLDEILAIEEESFNHPWSREYFECEINSDNAFFLVGIIDEKIVAYVGYSEMEIINLAVALNMRRCGIGEEILTALINGLKQCRVTKELWLNVRPSNTAAIKLYEKIGFKHIATDKGYYYDEDSLVMRKIL